MEAYSGILSVCISLALLLCLYVLWRDYWVDELRDKLFALRDEMFLYAYENNILDTQAHRFLRDLMNSVIRYAHEISIGRLLVLMFAHSLLGSPPTDKFTVGWNSVTALPAPHREAMTRYQMQMASLMGRQLIKTSLALRVIALLFGFLLKLIRGDADGDIKKKMTKKMPVVLLEQDALISCSA